MLRGEGLDGLGHFGGAGGFVFGEGDRADEDFQFRDEIWRGLHALDGESAGVAGVGMADGSGLGRGVVNGQVRGDLAGTFPRACDLASFAVDHAEHVGRHESLAHAGGRANVAVGSDARGNVAAVAVAVFAEPDAASDLADFLFEFFGQRRAEQCGVFGGGHGGEGRGFHGGTAFEDDLDAGVGENVAGPRGEQHFSVVAEFFGAGFGERGGVLVGEYFHDCGWMYISSTSAAQ